MRSIMKRVFMQSARTPSTHILFGRLFSSKSPSSISKPRPNSGSYRDLPVLAKMIDHLAKPHEKPLSKSAVVYVHHALGTSLNVVDSLFHLGLRPEDTFVVSKHYSENTDVVEQLVERGVYYQPSSLLAGLGKFNETFTQDVSWLWKEVVDSLSKRNHIENVVVLDHGGHALHRLPQSVMKKYNVIGMEKTTSGLDSARDMSKLIPVIDVAGCAAKKFLESPLIASAIDMKLAPLAPEIEPNSLCGIVGYGSIGKHLADFLSANGHQVLVFDAKKGKRAKANQDGYTSCEDMTALLCTANVIFGCTGTDISTNSAAFSVFQGQKLLVSCSSNDTEFLTLLKEVQRQLDKPPENSLDDVFYQNALGGRARIFRGGFPANFDQSGESVPANDIQLTRGLVLGGVLQMIDMLSCPKIMRRSGMYNLDADIQQFIVETWLNCKPRVNFDPELLARFSDKAWITHHSKSEGSLVLDMLEADDPALTKQSYKPLFKCAARRADRPVNKGELKRHDPSEKDQEKYLAMPFK